MQDGFIFSDTIPNNIAVGYHRQAKTASCRREGKHKKFIKSLPLKYNTKIGMEGNGISQGRCQRLRLLIARAVYKNPDFLF